MNRRKNGTPLVQTRPVRLALAALVLAATGALTVTFVSSGGKGTADAATSLDQFVPIENVSPNVQNLKPAAGASTGRFTVDCGTNGNGKFSPDNPVAQPGIRNGAEHVHDFVGNLAITANSSNADLDASGTTCRNGDKSSYFWPVVRIDKSARSNNQVQQALAQTQPVVVCPSVGKRLRAVPTGARGTVDRLLAELDRQQAAANQRMTASRGRIDAAFNREVIDSLRERRAAMIKQISTTSPPPAATSLAWSRSSTVTSATTTCTPGCRAAPTGRASRRPRPRIRESSARPCGTSCPAYPIGPLPR